MLDAILTYAIVVMAAAFVVWKVLLPVQARTKVRALVSGTKAPCAPEPDGCAHGCAGCGLAKRPATKLDGP